MKPINFPTGGYFDDCTLRPCCFYRKLTFCFVFTHVAIYGSVNAYRSIRVKEMERPHVKQVIVRKEDVSNRAEEPRGTVHFNIKQKMKV